MGKLINETEGMLKYIRPQIKHFDLQNNVVFLRENELQYQPCAPFVTWVRGGSQCLYLHPS